MPDIKGEELLQAFTKESPPLDFVLPGMLAGTVGSIVSPGGMGKSFFALQLAAQISGGLDLLGLGELKRGGVLYAAAEDPKRAICHRLHSFSRYIGEDQLSGAIKNLVIDSRIGEPSNILNPKVFSELKNKALGKRLIIIDTLRRFHNEDENASGPMAQVIGRMEALCSETGSSLLFVHHSSKSTSTYGNQAQSSRGSGALVDNIRWQSQLMPVGKDDVASIRCDRDFAQKKLVKFRITKQNYGKPKNDIILFRGDGGLLLNPKNVEKNL